MDDPTGMWHGMEAYLKALPASLPEPPKAILLVSAHWETRGFGFTSGAQADLIFDYYGFPPHTYELTYDAPGDPALATRAATLLAEAGFTAGLAPERGWDHGVFVPLKVAWPDADVPVVEMSLDASLDPALHLAAGRALAPLRDEGVLIVGSGMSFHNMRAYGDPGSSARAADFDRWLIEAATAPAETRAAMLADWKNAPAGPYAHPREEHLLPLMVAAGASDAAGVQTYGEKVMETALSGFAFA
jgi:aromatic ring-opening dioxygenase catalytic subunit (LigB family)